MTNVRKLPLVWAALAVVVVGAIIGGAVLSGPSSSQGSFVAPSGLDPSGSAGIVGSDGRVEPDPNFQEALRQARLSTRGWKTDFSLHTVPFSDFLSGGPGKDGIPAIDKPRFVTPEEASDWIASLEPVIFLEINGDARAYPLQVMTWHEIANDVVGGVPVTVTFYPLCNSAIVFERTLDGAVLDFGVSGNLRFSDLVMFDRQTETWWQQFTGEAVVGELSGKNLTLLSSSIISFEDFVAANPEGQVLSRETGFSRSYGQNPYAGYDRVDNSPFLFRGDTDGRLLPKERVAAVTVGDKEIVVFFKRGTLSALDSSSIKRSKDIGASGVFDAELDGRKFTFRAEGDNIVDNETGSQWNILGEATSGPLAGQQLTPVVHGDHFWFAWAAFKPDTKIYRGVG